MKNILLIALTFFCTNVFAQGKFDTDGDLAPTGAYGIVKARNLRGGYLGSVYDTVARNLIPISYRDSNTLVFTRLDSTLWMLKGGLANNNWAVFSAGGSSLPSQTGNAGKYLTTDATNASWERLKLLDSIDYTNAGTATVLRVKPGGSGLYKYEFALGGGINTLTVNLPITSTGSSTPTLAIDSHR